MWFYDFIHNYKLKKKATSIIKTQQIFSSIGLDNVDTYLRDGPFSSDIGILNLYPTKRTLWVPYINGIYFGSFDCWPPQKRSKFILKQNGSCLYSEYKIQSLTKKRDSFCASYCLFINHLTKVSGTEFKSDVLNLYYQMIQKCWYCLQNKRRLITI